MYKVSIIIPVYNVEQYLAQCLDSVINQTYKNIEIICVNDCSLDNSFKILDEYSKNDKRIKIINRENNGGLSAARNTGLDNASGKYIYFLDSDDWIDLDYIEKMLNAAIKNEVEVVLNTNIIEHKLNQIEQQFAEHNTQNFIKDTFLDAKFCVWNIIWNSWAYLWKKSFLDKIKVRFPEGYINEDMYFQAITLINLDKIYVIRNSSYHYVIRDDSICGLQKNNNLKIFKNLIKIMNKTVDFLQKKALLDKIQIKLFSYIPLDGIEEYREEIILELTNYFKRIEKNVLKNKSLYDAAQYALFYDVLYNPSVVRIEKYHRIAIFEKVRNIKNKLITDRKMCNLK